MGIDQRTALLETIHRVVIKIGSGVLAAPGHEGLSHTTLHRLVKDICDLERDGRFEVVLVSSGSVMAGAKHLDLRFSHLSIPMKQAAAAVGQVTLMNLYERYFTEEGKKIGQILMTHDDISNRRRFLNARNTMTTLLELGVMPIINENDSTAVHEIKFGDNDTLAGMITSVVDADLLLILSDVDGLYDADPTIYPEATLIEEVDRIDDAVRNLAGSTRSTTGVGGMKAKIMAAEKAAVFGIPTWIVGGTRESSIPDALRKGKGGTFFHPATTRINQRKHWIGHLLKPRGTITVDDGAKTALTEKGKSLLPSGMRRIEGVFESGEAVVLADERGTPFARGLVNYHSFELERIKGKKTVEIEAELGYKTYDEVIHRDDMVLLQE